MITAVDTNVLLDVLTGDPRHGPASRRALERCIAEGSVVASATVWAELTAAYDEPDEAARVFDMLGIGFVPVDRAAAAMAGAAWRAYRRGGGTRARIMTDFLIAAHAQSMADRLLTRDSGFYRWYFSHLAVILP